MLITRPSRFHKRASSLHVLVEISALAPDGLVLFEYDRPAESVDALHFDVFGVVSVKKLGRVRARLFRSAKRAFQKFIAKRLLPAALLPSTVTLLRL